MWALGNIAGDSPTCRDFVLGQGVLAPLLALLHDSSKEVSLGADSMKKSMVGNATWTLSNLCRGKPQPAFEQVGVNRTGVGWDRIGCDRMGWYGIGKLVAEVRKFFSQYTTRFDFLCQGKGIREKKGMVERGV